MKNKSVIWWIIILFLLSLISYSPSNLADEESYLMNFYSYLEIEYDSSTLNQTLEIGVVYEIPITVNYYTTIPDAFESMPSKLINYFLFNTTIKPMKEIKLEVENTPSWADIYFTSPEILVDIPYESGKSSAEAILVIKLSSVAPKKAYNINLVVSTEQVKRLIGFTNKKLMIFTPKYVPSIEITNDYPQINADRINKTIIPIEVINKGNQVSQITSSLIYDNSSYFDVIIEPISMILNIEEKGTFNLSVNLNSEFGFFEDININESVEIKFKCEEYSIDDINNSIQKSTFISITYSQNDFDAFLDSYLTTILIIIFIICLTIILLIWRWRVRKN
ncbi:MAG: hypothetical protein KAJ21_05440 [Thermoplasmatales archaeon]|nr:hypothetical protein [Thermoplasmatales archaeon]